MDIQPPALSWQRDIPVRHVLDATGNGKRIPKEDRMNFKQHIFILFIALLHAGLLLATVFSIPAAAGDWPGWRGPNRDGKSTDTGLLKAWPAEGPELLWAYKDLGKGFSSMAIVKDTVYTTGDVDSNLVIFALDTKGQLKWKAVQGPAWTAPHGGARSTPVVDGDRLYLIGGNGLVTCHSTADGKLVWKRDLKDFGGGHGTYGYAESPLIVDNMVIATPGKTAFSWRSTRSRARTSGKAMPRAMPISSVIRRPS
jgi:outer membrane protein assembly factor BamB